WVDCLGVSLGKGMEVLYPQHDLAMLVLNQPKLPTNQPTNQPTNVRDESTVADRWCWTL
ncbi:hypothetical protein ACJMK2_035043, partial [Sinanodonta woodiana]